MSTGKSTRPCVIGLSSEWTEKWSRWGGKWPGTKTSENWKFQAGLPGHCKCIFVKVGR